MQVSVEKTSPLERRIKVEVPAEDFNREVDSKIRDLGKNVRLKGFRPGKVPLKVLRKRFGSQVREEVTGDYVRDSLTQAIKDEDLRLASGPNVEDLENEIGKPLTFSAVVEVYPELEEVDFSELEITRPTAEVAESDVDEMIETLRKQQRKFNEVDRAAGEGDLVLFEFSLSAGDKRHPDEGVERAGTVIGSNAFLPEVEQALPGMSQGDETSVDVSVPADYHVRELAGDKAQASIRITRVSEPALPEVDEDFAKAFGVHEGGVEALREEVKGNLQRELDQAIRSEMKDQVVEKLQERFAEIELPASLVKQEAATLRNQHAARMSEEEGQEVDPASVPPEMFTEDAQRRVRAGVVLSEIARQKDIAVDSDRVHRMIMELASTYEQPEEVASLYYQNENLLEQIRSRALEDTVVDHIVEHSTVTDQPSSFSEILRKRAESQRNQEAS